MGILDARLHQCHGVIAREGDERPKANRLVDLQENQAEGVSENERHGTPEYSTLMVPMGEWQHAYKGSHRVT